MTFKAKCIKTTYKKNGVNKGNVSFEEGKTYTFKDVGISVGHIELDGYTSVNEQGINSTMREVYFKEHFEREDLLKKENQK